MLDKPSSVEVFTTLLLKRFAVLVANHDPSSCLSRASLKHELDAALFDAQTTYGKHLNRELEEKLKKAQPV